MKTDLQGKSKTTLWIKKNKDIFKGLEWPKWAKQEIQINKKNEKFTLTKDSILKSNKKLLSFFERKF
jgi:hypothetical protein